MTIIILLSLKMLRVCLCGVSMAEILLVSSLLVALMNFPVDYDAKFTAALGGFNSLKILATRY